MLLAIKKVYNNSRLLVVYDPNVFKWKKNEKGEYVCMNCGKSLVFNKRLRTYCSGTCQSEYFKENILTWERVREQVWNRDHCKCVKCGRGVALYPISEGVLGGECDHIVPLFKGGNDWHEDLPELKNFQTLCENCHREKSREEAKERTKVGIEVISGKQKQLIVFA
jgi:hypothetical protein